MGDKLRFLRPADHGYESQLNFSKTWSRFFFWTALEVIGYLATAGAKPFKALLE